MQKKGPTRGPGSSLSIGIIYAVLSTAVPVPGAGAAWTGAFTPASSLSPSWSGPCPSVFSEPAGVTGAELTAAILM